MEKILIVDDNKDLCWALSNILMDEGYVPIEANTGKEALIKIAETPSDLILLDLKLPDSNGVDVLSRIREINKNIPAIIITAHGDIPSAVNAMKMGAVDYLQKPFDNNELLLTIKKALQIGSILTKGVKGVKRLKDSHDNENLISSSPQILSIIEQIKIVAPTDMTVLMQGESGTGKDLVSKLVHSNSNRSDKPFITMDCGTIPESLIESEMFGYEKGAFTGAEKTKEGIFEMARGGTIFLNEIGNLSEAAQRRFLSVIENKQLQRLGGQKNLGVDLRVIAATNLPLKEAVKSGKFRQDLFFRLSQFPIHIPPLRHRPDDILPIVRHFLCKANSEMKRDIRQISPEAERLLHSYSWPGNVRELKNVIRRAVLVAKDSTIRQEDLCLDVDETIDTPNGDLCQSGDKGQLRIAALRNDWERELIMRALTRADGNKKKAAQILGIGRSALYSKMERLGMKDEIR